DYYCWLHYSGTWIF
nr:immunoglobulin light chain junction region [Macaca mulatta]